MRPQDRLIDRVCGLIGNCLNAEIPAPDSDLIDSGLLDSLALISLIAELEEIFSFEFPLDDFDVEHFRSPARLADFLAHQGVLLAAAVES